MASISNKPNNYYDIQFSYKDKRHTVRLGKLSKADALAAKRNIERLVECRIIDKQISSQLSEWLAALKPIVFNRLVRAGLVERRQGETLAEMKNWVVTAPGKRNTVRNRRVAFESLINYFGGGRSSSTLSENEAREWVDHLMQSGLAGATVGQYVAKARWAWNEAIDQRWLVRNPWRRLHIDETPSQDRKYYVSQAESAECLSKLTDPELRLAFVLARFGGLRIPSELEKLQLDHFDREARLFRVHAPKKDRITGRRLNPWRVVPLFDEILAELPEADPLFTRSHNTLRERMFKQLGVTKSPWPKFWTNMRSTRETELLEVAPLHVVCAWLGNTPKVANDHYLQITQDHLSAALSASANLSATN